MHCAGTNSASAGPKGPAVNRQDIARIVEAHRQDWPTERIRSDPAGFLSICDNLLNLFREQHRDGAGWLNGPWADLLFGDHPAADDSRSTANDPTFFRRH